MKNIACLISGRGSNLEAILTAQSERQWAQRLGARVAAVVSNRAGVRGLEIARAHGVDALVVPHGQYASREEFDAALAQRLEAYAPDLVVLAGFLRVLTPGLVRRFEGRMINIHPSLLPAFAGLDTHERALAAGVRVHGATVHFVSGDLDAGPIIGQAVLGVKPGESAAALAARVLALEHVLLPRCIEWVLQGQVRLESGRVVTEGLDARQLVVWGA